MAVEELVKIDGERRQDLHIGRVRIPNAISINSANGKEERISELKRVIEEIKSSPLSVEQEQLQLSLEEMCRLRYPVLDLSFLSEMPSTIKHKGEKVQLPRFGVYHIDEKEFSISIRNPTRSPILFSFLDWASSLGGLLLGGTTLGYLGMKSGEPSFFNAETAIGAIFGYIMGCMPTWMSMASGKRDYNTLISNERRVLPPEFKNRLVRSIELSDFVVPQEIDGVLVHDRIGIPLEIRKKFKKLGDTRFRSGVGFIVPSETKRNIREAEGYFGRQNLYFIAEVRPEDWHVGRLIKEDPLVVGLSKGKCYLVDSFNPTILEKAAEEKGYEHLKPNPSRIQTN